MEYMKPMKLVSLPTDPNRRRSCLCSFFSTASLFFVVLLIGSAFIAPDHKERLYRWGMIDSLESPIINECKKQCRPSGSETLPEGIVAKTSNLQMRPLWGFPKNDNSSTNLFAAAVGIKQRDLVDKMIRKFLSSDFAVILFHYDGIVDEWKEFEWSDRVIHVSAHNQTKWRTYKPGLNGKGGCDGSSVAPPCTGY